MSRKNVIIAIAATLGLAGTIAATFPGAGPAVGVALHAAGEGLQQVGDSLLDECSRETCGCDAKGECGWHGPMSLDGGTCNCP